MTAYIYTPKQHAHITKYYGLMLDDIDPIEWLDTDLVLMREMLAMLKDMEPVERPELTPAEIEDFALMFTRAIAAAAQEETLQKITDIGQELDALGIGNAPLK